MRRKQKGKVAPEGFDHDLRNIVFYLAEGSNQLQDKFTSLRNMMSNPINTAALLSPTHAKLSLTHLE
jgi:hypothetical protein